MEPERFNVAELDECLRALFLEEKPAVPKPVTGSYFYDKHIAEMAKQVKPSSRNELVITTLNQINMRSMLNCLAGGVVWLDNRTHDSLTEALIPLKSGKALKCLSLENCLL